MARIWRLTDEQRDNIVLLRDKGFDINGIASVMSIGPSTVRYNLRAFDRVKAMDYDAIREDNSLMANVGAIQWACRNCGIDENKFLERLVNGEPKEQEEPKEPETKEESHISTTASDIEDAIHVATKLMTADITSAIELQTEMIVKKLDQIAVIIQSCSKDEVEKTNCNADVVLQEVKKLAESVSFIRNQAKVR